MWNDVQDVIKEQRRLYAAETLRSLDLADVGPLRKDQRRECFSTKWKTKGSEIRSRDPRKVNGKLAGAP